MIKFQTIRNQKKQYGRGLDQEINKIMEAGPKVPKTPISSADINRMLGETKELGVQSGLLVNNLMPAIIDPMAHRTPLRMDRKFDATRFDCIMDRIAELDELIEVEESALDIKGDNIEDNSKNLEEVAATSDFWTLVDESLEGERIELEFINEETDFSRLPEDKRMLYKFRLTGATLGEAIQTIWAPKDIPMRDLEILVMKRYNLDPKLFSVNFLVNGKMIKTGQEIEGYTITPDSTANDITTMIGAITVICEQAGGRPFTDTEVGKFLYEMDYITGNNLGHQVVSYEDELVFQDFYQDYFKPLKIAFRQKFGIDNLGSHQFVEDGMHNLLKNTWCSKERLDKIPPQHRQAYIDFVEKVFEFKFKNPLDNTRESKLNDIIEHVVNRLVFKHITRGYLDLDQKGVSPDMFIDRLEQFIMDMSVGYGFGYQSLQDDVLDEGMLTEFFLILADSFMASSEDQITKEEVMRRLSIEPIRENTFFGWIHESSFFFGVYPDRVIDMLEAADFDIPLLYTFMEQNPNFADRLIAENYNKEILQGQIREIRELINNGIDTAKYVKLPSNGRDFDLLVLVLSGAIHSSHLGTLRDLKDTGSVKRMIMKLPADYIGTIIADSQAHFITDEYKKYGVVVGPEHVALLCSPIYGTGDASKDLMNAIATVRRIGSIDSTDEIAYNKDRKGETSNFKGPLDLIFYHRIAKLINKYSDVGPSLGIFDSDVELEFQLPYIFASPDFKIEFEKEVYNVFKKNRGGLDTKYDQIRRQGDSFFESVKSLFLDNIDKLLKKIPGTDEYEVVWRDDIGLYFLRKDASGSPVKLDVSMLPPDCFLLDSNFKKVERDNIKQSHLSSPLVIIHDESGQNGLISAQMLRDLPKDYGIGFRDKDGVVHPNAFITNEKGQLLIGRVLLKLLPDNNKFDLLLDGIYNSYIEKNLRYDEAKCMFILENSYSSIIFSTGDCINAFFQKATVNLVPTESYKPLFPDAVIQSSARSRTTEESRTVEPIRVRDNIDASTLALTYAFSTLMRNIIDPIIPSSVIHHSDDLVITNDVFKIGSDGDIEYSLKYFREDVMNKLNPDSDQLKKINPVSITTDGVSLEFNEEFSRKEFYRTYFELLWQHRTDPAFKEYFTSKWLGENPILLSPGDTVLESDVTIMRKIDAVLQRIYGHVGLTLIKLGVLKFRRIGDKNFEVRATALDAEYLEKMVVKWQIKSLRSGSLENFLSYFSRILLYRMRFSISSLLSGYSNIFKVDDGTGTIKECSFSSIPNTDFLEKIFENLDQYDAYDFKRHKQISDRFLEKFYPKTFSEYVMTAQLNILDYMNMYRASVIDGRYDYLEAIWRVIDVAAAKTITQEYFDALPQKYGYKSKEAFLFHSNQKAKLDYRDRLFQKGKALRSDLIIPLRNMISQNLGSCTLEVGTQSDNLFLQDLSVILSREYLGDDLNKYVPMTDFYYNSFINHPEMVKKWDSIYKVENIWEKIKGPIRELKDYFEKELQKVVFNGESEAFMDDEFEVSFYAASPSGIDGASTLKKMFPNKDWAKTSVSFTRSDINRYIWGIIYYMVAFDSTIIIREAGDENRPTILSMSLLGGVIVPDYLDKEGFRVYPLGKGKPGCASENYGKWTDKIREIVRSMPLYPIQLLSDADNFAILFRQDFSIQFLQRIRFLERTW